MLHWHTDPEEVKIENKLTRAGNVLCAVRPRQYLAKWLLLAVLGLDEGQCNLV